ncbi:DUF488 domain-containing protein [Corynebacterium vitaeruminis]|uniref:Uroporphyrin-III C-methyltransferase n=1 Tax=Corynebacterium vitaeruminis DSM 20294 TaxID=1224164 RepID=W5Y6N2_9CORY|nr:DUF488 family protein [Corynebacterium vitaeruminis]AHI22183.1 hypothetical protein B843_03970 [Corynebacterium vitaeruminis DSM 20294]
MITAAKIHDVLRGTDSVTGTGVICDRLWPRGVSKADTEGFLWLKGIAPSPGLRKWFGHDPDRFEEFAARYRAELDEAFAAGNEDVKKLLQLGDATLLYAAKDRAINHAEILRDWANEKAR